MCSAGHVHAFSWGMACVLLGSACVPLGMCSAGHVFSWACACVLLGSACVPLGMCSVEKCMCRYTRLKIGIVHSKYFGWSLSVVTESPPSLRFPSVQ